MGSARLIQTAAKAVVVAYSAAPLYMVLVANIFAVLDCNKVVGFWILNCFNDFGKAWEM